MFSEKYFRHQIKTQDLQSKQKKKFKIVFVTSQHNLLLHHCFANSSMEFGKFCLPPSSNWFYPHLLDVSSEGLIAYGSKSSVAVLEYQKCNGE